MTDTERRDCPTCTSRDVTEQHIGRCAIVTRERAAAKALGTAQGIPEVTTDDLWSHLGHIGSVEDSTRVIRQVIDLGWRPVVGKDPARLWQVPATPEPRLPDPGRGIES